MSRLHPPENSGSDLLTSIKQKHAALCQGKFDIFDDCSTVDKPLEICRSGSHRTERTILEETLFADPSLIDTNSVYYGHRLSKI